MSECGGGALVVSEQRGRRGALHQDRVRLQEDGDEPAAGDSGGRQRRLLRLTTRLPRRVQGSGALGLGEV